MLRRRLWNPQASLIYKVEFWRMVSSFTQSRGTAVLKVDKGYILKRFKLCIEIGVCNYATGGHEDEIICSQFAIKISVNCELNKLHMDESQL